MKKLLFIGLLLVFFDTFSQNNVNKNYMAPYFQGSMKVKDTLGVENIFLVDTIGGFSSSNIIISDTVAFLTNTEFKKRIAVGATASIDPKALIKVSETQSTAAVSHFGYGLHITPTLSIGVGHGGSFLRGISVIATVSGTGIDGTLQAIHALATYENTGNGATVNAISAKISTGGSASAPTDPAVIIIETPFFSGTKPTNYHGLHIQNQGVAGITTSYGLKIEDQSLSGTFYSIKTGAGIVKFGDSLIIEDNLEVSGDLMVIGDIGIFGTQGFADSSVTIAMTQNVYHKITNSSSDLYTIGINIGDLVFTGDSIQVVTAGHYELSYDLSFSGANTDQYHLGFFVNNVEQAGKGETERDMSIADVGVSAGSTILNIAAGQWIAMRIKNVQNNNDATIKAGNVTIKKL